MRVRSKERAALDDRSDGPPDSLPGTELGLWAPFSGARIRILAAFVVLTAASAALGLILIRDLLLSRLDGEIEQNLTQEAEEFQRLVLGDDPQTGQPFGTDVHRIFDVYFSRNVPNEGEVLMGSIDGVLYRSARAGDAEYQDGEVLRTIALAGSLNETHRGVIDVSTGSVYYLNIPLEIGEGVQAAFTVTNFPAHEREEIQSAITVAAQVFASVLLVSFAVAWVAAGRVLAPLRTLQKTAQSITETDLTQRIAVRGQDEVARLGRTFNAMLARLEVAFSAQQRFVDDAGHELRTPITIVRGHIELLSDDPAERRETVALVTDELDRMSRIVSDLLLLAKAQQPDFLRPESVDVATLTSELHAKLSAIAPRDWQVESVGHGLIRADRQRLTQAVIELAENATKQTEVGGVVALGSFVADGEARFWVRDTGPGIPGGEQTRIFGRFARGSSTRRTDGAGLGLSIVDAIARAHGGRVELSSHPGHGATFTVVVPSLNTEAPT
ncbi:MAG: HAMP domain-containing histidine kinase [Actinobacteria bacterium]|nr:HAMP domain-containing histidine kinase [Actinomycetota bacterium]